MSKLCLQCGRKLAFLTRTEDQFCSSEHSELYHQEQAKLVFQRVMGIGNQLGPSEEIAEAQRSIQGRSSARMAMADVETLTTNDAAPSPESAASPEPAASESASPEKDTVTAPSTDSSMVVCEENLLALIGAARPELQPPIAPPPGQRDSSFDSTWRGRGGSEKE